MNTRRTAPALHALQWIPSCTLLLLSFLVQNCGGVSDKMGEEDAAQPEPIGAEGGVTKQDGAESEGKSDASSGDVWQGDVDDTNLSVCDEFTTQTCRMRYTAPSGEIQTTLEVRRLGARRLVVTDGPTTESPWEEIVDIEPDGTLATQAGVPAVTCKQLVEKYTEASSWETYEQEEGYPCSELDAALIRFFVVEWFYFG